MTDLFDIVFVEEFSHRGVVYARVACICGFGPLASDREVVVARGGAFRRGTGAVGGFPG